MSDAEPLGCSVKCPGTPSSPLTGGCALDRSKSVELTVGVWGATVSTVNRNQSLQSPQTDGAAATQARTRYSRSPSGSTCWLGTVQDDNVAPSLPLDGTLMSEPEACISPEFAPCP